MYQLHYILTARLKQTYIIKIPKPMITSLIYDSTHPDHFKDNVPYNLAKRIIAFAKKIHNIG